MVAFARYMMQQATYWAPGPDDDTGGRVFAAPVLIACRWQNDAVLFRDAKAREATSSAVVYADRALEIGGYLLLGDGTTSDDPRGLDGAHEVRQVYASPSLDASETLHKVML